MSMFVSGQWCLMGKEEFRVHMHGDIMFFTIKDGAHDLCFSGSYDALDRLCMALMSHLQDMQRRAHPETCQGEAEALDVIDPEQRMSPEEIKAGIKAGMEAERRK